MGHASGKDVFEQLGDKLSGIGTYLKSVNDDRFAAILRTLYTPDEADFVLRMPYGFRDVETIARVTGVSSARCRELLGNLADKGLVQDLEWNGREIFTPAPYLVGFFEFTLMRRGDELPFAEWARLFSEYRSGLYAANRENDRMLPLARALPHEAARRSTEILNHERARHLLAESDFIAVGTCACRHEKHHLGERTCVHPLESCMSLGVGARYLVRHDMARPLGREEALAMVDASPARGLVLTCDNVREDAMFLCQCCSCCCSLLQGLRSWGWSGLVESSQLVVRVESGCKGCGLCVRKCPVNALSLPRRGQVACVSEDACLGCGVCTFSCPVKALTLVPRERRVFHPENVIERLVLANLEQGTLQNFLFDNPNSRSHAFLRSLTAVLLRSPRVRDVLRDIGVRSRFFAFIRRRVSLR